MTALCDFCATNPAVSGGLCGRCESEQQRLGRLDYPAHAQHSDNPRPDTGKRHEQRVRDTRQHLGELPELYAQLGMFVLPGSTPPDPDQRSGKANPAWRCVVNLDVLDLTDAREKSNSDPTRTDAGIDSYIGTRREGAAKVLHKWALRLDGELWDDEQEHVPAPEDAYISSDCGFLLTHLAWVAEQSWFLEVHDDVRMIWADVRRAIGDRDLIALRCRYCGNPVHPVDADYLPTSWEACAYGMCEACPRGIFKLGPELAALGKVQESVPLDTISKTLGIPLPTLYRWWKLHVFEVAPESPKRPTNRKPALFDLATVREQVSLLRSA